MLYERHSTIQDKTIAELWCIGPKQAEKLYDDIECFITDYIEDIPKNLTPSIIQFELIFHRY